MKAVQFPEPKSLQLIDVPEPGAPGPGEVLVQVHQVGICGTDYSGYLGRMPFFSYPRIWGHELGVEVLAVGQDVDNVKIGDKCSVEPYMNNPDSFASRQGASNCCNDLQVIGVHKDGGLRERFILPARKLHPGNQLTYEQLALVETLAIGYHAVQRGNPSKDQTVAIVGAGPIGLSALEFVRLRGCRSIMVDIQPDRLEFCQQRMGVKETIVAGDDTVEQLARMTDGQLAPVVIDATGNPKSMSQALELVAYTGTLVYVGITSEIVSFPHPALHKKEMDLLASRNALPQDFDEIIQLIADGKIDTNPWITHRTSIDQIADQFADFLKPGAQVLKAMVEVAP